MKQKYYKIRQNASEFPEIRQVGLTTTICVPRWLQEVAESACSGLILNDSDLGKRLTGSELH